jgi:hypothetical protein
MHRLENRIYAGGSGESVTLTLTVRQSGTLVVALDEVDIGANRSFALKPNPGDETRMSITLFGPAGETCVVSVATVDGGRDGDLLVCQPHDPAPTHFYRFIVADPGTLAALGLTRAAGPS